MRTTPGQGHRLQVPCRPQASVLREGHGCRSCMTRLGRARRSVAGWATVKRGGARLLHGNSGGERRSHGMTRLEWFPDWKEQREAGQGALAGGRTWAACRRSSQAGGSGRRGLPAASGRRGERQSYPRHWWKWKEKQNESVRR